MENKEPDSRLSVKKEDLDDKELYRLNQVINDLYSKVSTARDETAEAASKFVRSGVISSINDQSTTPPTPPPSSGIPQPASGDWALKSVVYSAGEDGLQYGFASAEIYNKSAAVDYYSMFIQDYSSGYVDTNGTAVTLTSASKEAGNTFENCIAGQVININGVAYTIAATPTSPFESLTITTSAGVQSNKYFNLNAVDGGKWEEIASDAEAGTWQLRPPTGWDVPCCLTASTKDEKVYQPADGVNYKRLVFSAWSNAPQVANFSVELDQQDPSTTDIPSGRFVVNFTKPLDPEYYYASIERLQYENSSYSGVIGPTAVVNVSGDTVTYNSSSSLYTTLKFKGQFFNYLQPGDTVYIGSSSSVSDTDTYVIKEVVSNTVIKLTTSPSLAGDRLFAQWGRVAGEINPFTQTDYWPLPTTAEYWRFRSRSVNHREAANNTSPPAVTLLVPASGGITPLTPATPLGSSDWSLNALVTSTDDAGNSYIFVSATIVTPSANADYYSLFWQKTTSPISGEWIEIAADAVAGTWQPWPSEGDTYVVSIAANKNTYKKDQPDVATSGYKNLVIPAWGPADQVSNFSVSIEEDNKAGVQSGRFVVNFDPPVDVDYYYASIERLPYAFTSPPSPGSWPSGSPLGATAIVDVNSSTRVITYSTSGWPSGFVGQKFAYIQDGDTVYLGTSSTLTDSNSYTVEEVISSTQLKLTTVPSGSPTGVLFAQWGRIAGEKDSFTQTDYWPLPISIEYWKFRSRSVNYRRVANNTSPPTVQVSVPVGAIDVTKSSGAGWTPTGTLLIKSSNTNAPLEVTNTSILSTSYIGANQVGVRNSTSGNFYPYSVLNRNTSSGFSELATYGGPSLTTTDSWCTIYASTTPTNSYALFRNMPIKVGDSSAAGGVTVIDEYRRGFFTDLNCNVFRLGTTSTAGYVLTTDSQGIGTWQAVPSGISSINSQTGPSITIAASTGISISSATNTITITNSGVTSLAAGTGISLSSSTGSITVTNSGVTSLTGTTNQVTVSASTGSVTLSLPQNINTTATPTFTAVIASAIGTNSATALDLKTDSTVRWSVSSTGMFIPSAADTYDIGISSSNRVRGVYSKYVDTTKSGAVGDYAKSSLFRFSDTTGGAGYWDTFANASSIGTSNFTIKDNAGSRLMVGWRASGGSAVNYTYWYGDLIPALRSTAGGDAVNDVFYPTLGSATYPWGVVYASQISVAGTVNSDLVPFGTNTYDLGDSTYRWASAWTVALNISGALTANGSAGSSGQLLSTTGSVAQWVNISSQLSAGTGISLSGTTSVTITNSGVTSLTGTSNQVTVSASTGSVTISLPQSIATTSSVTFNSVTLANGDTNGLSIKDSGGTSRVVLTLASNNNLYLDNNDGGYDIYIRPASGRYTFVDGSYFAPYTNNAISLGYNGQGWSNVYSYAYWAHNGSVWSAGWTGTFDTGDSRTATVQDGIIISVA